MNIEKSSCTRRVATSHAWLAIDQLMDRPLNPRTHGDSENTEALGCYVQHGAPYRVQRSERSRYVASAVHRHRKAWSLIDQQLLILRRMVAYLDSPQYVPPLLLVSPLVSSTDMHASRGSSRTLASSHSPHVRRNSVSSQADSGWTSSSPTTGCI